MIIKPLYSSSSGNVTVVETEKNILMIDAGVSYKRMVEAYGADINPTALFITHGHGDHISSAGVVGRKTGCPIYISKVTHESKESLFYDCDVKFIMAGDTICFADITVTAFSTRHDSPDSMGFIFVSDDKKFSYVTDTGGFTKTMLQAISDSDAYFMESDYDEEALDKYEEYDDVLKERINSPFGHLSNQQVIDYFKNINDMEKTAFVILGHLSAHTNSPEILTNRLKNYFDEDILSKFYIANQPIVLNI